LSLYNLAGEKAFNAEVQGAAELNTLVWNLQNNANQPVASGLYIYALFIGDGPQMTRHVGKVVVIR
jgi:hypothetical protein